MRLLRAPAGETGCSERRYRYVLQGPVAFLFWQSLLRLPPGFPHADDGREEGALGMSVGGPAARREGCNEWHIPLLVQTSHIRKRFAAGGVVRRLCQTDVRHGVCHVRPRREWPRLGYTEYVFAEETTRDACWTSRPCSQTELLVVCFVVVCFAVAP